MRHFLLPLIALLQPVSGCGPGTPDYFPLDGPRTREFRLSVETADEHATHRQLLHHAGTVHRDGREVGVFEHSAGGRQYYVRTAEGVRWIATARAEDGAVTAQAGEPFVIREPVTVGMEWEVPSRLALAESVFHDNGERVRSRQTPVTLRHVIVGGGEEVTTPAGHFEGCLRVHATGRAIVRVNWGANFGTVEVDQTDWYAPGIGLVKSRRIETSDSPYLKPGESMLELARYD